MLILPRRRLLLASLAAPAIIRARADDMNLLGVGNSGATASAPSTWNPSFKGPVITLSNGNRTATHDGSGSENGVGGTLSHADGSGKWYVEWQISGGSGAGAVVRVGWVSASYSPSTNDIGDSHGCGWDSNTGNNYCNFTTLGTAAAYVSVTGTLCGAIDMVNRLVYWRINGGNWNNSGTANPDTNTGGFSYASAGGDFPSQPLFPGFSCQFVPNINTLCVTSAQFLQTKPSTYTQWG